MDEHVIVGEYFPKNNIDMGDVVPEHIDDMVRHLQGNFEEYVSQEYEWAMVEHPEWFGDEERDEDEEMEEEEEGEGEENIEMTEEEGIAHWQMMRAQMREEVSACGNAGVGRQRLISMVYCDRRNKHQKGIEI